ncbi:MAG: 16S rRNA (cytidine(1402)-2'-O)-methyltransferase [Firmicutes bacterium]|nr:16S rRNA (cytidine(1402)-2'-O)-methyltransferase [Bacillota bacterium]
MAGILYLVATPIGNLEDISARALRILSEVDCVAAEDTRVSGGLLHHFGIKKPLVSYYEQNKHIRGPALLERLLQGESIALISDAGTPAISDPGADLTRAAIDAGIQVTPIPGPCAFVSALIASGLSTERFVFEGFLPRHHGERKRRLQSLAGEERTLIFYEAPHRLPETLADMAEVLGPQRKAVLARELTKLHEEYLRLTLAEAAELYRQQQPRGEYVLIVAGGESRRSPPPDLQALQDRLEKLLEQGMSRKQAAKTLAGQYGLPVKSVYELGLK